MQKRFGMRMQDNPTTARPTMPIVYVREEVQWAYHVVTTGTPLDEADLTELGQDGWELTGILNQDGALHFYFKRPVVGK